VVFCITSQPKILVVVLDLGSVKIEKRFRENLRIYRLCFLYLSSFEILLNRKC
jgi:hypothetical protein